MVGLLLRKEMAEITTSQICVDIPSLNCVQKLTYLDAENITSESKIFTKHTSLFPILETMEERVDEPNVE